MGLISILQLSSYLGVYEEAKYFGIDEIIPQLESIIKENSKIPDECPLSRREVINAIIMTDSNRLDMDDFILNKQ